MVEGEGVIELLYAHVHRDPAVVGMSTVSERMSPFGGFEGFNSNAHFFDDLVHADLPLVDARERLDLGAVAPEHFFQRHRNLPDRGLGARGVDALAQRVTVDKLGGDETKMVIANSSLQENDTS